MPEKRFENELQEDMASLKFRPSDEVWQRIAIDLRRKKRRRAFFFLTTLIAIGLLSSTGYYFYQQNNKSVYASLPQARPTMPEKNQPASQLNSNASASDLPETAATALPAAGSQNNMTQTPELTVSKKDILKQSNNVAISDDITGVSSAKPGNKKIVKDSRAAKPRPTNTARNNKTSGKVTTSQLTSPAGNEQVHLNSKNDKKDNVLPGTNIERSDLLKDSSRTLVEPTVKASALNKGMLHALPMDSLALLASTPSPGRNAASRKKISWGFIAGAGITGSVDELPSFSNSQESRDPLYSNAPPGGGQAAPPVITPSTIKSGTGWKLGVTASYPLSARTRLTAALQYAHFTTRINVGAELDRGVSFDAINAQPVVTNALYRGAQTRPYTNSFNFVQLPIGFKFQLNRSKTTRINWSVSLVPGYLAGTNGLVYDTAFGGSYYISRKSLKQFRLGFGTGLSIGFGKPGQFQWSIGPDFYMDLRSITRPSFSARQYLLNAGITARIFLPRKLK